MLVGCRNLVALGLSHEGLKDAASAASQGTPSDSRALHVPRPAVFRNSLNNGISSLGPVDADAASAASVNTSPQWGEHKPNNAKRFKTDAAAAASGCGVLQPGILQSVDAASAASSGVGFNKGFELASGRFVFEGVEYRFGQVLSICKGLKALCYFPGPRRAGDFAEACMELGAVAKLVDVEVDDAHMDLLDEAVADMYLTEVRSKKFDAALMSMPCSTFSGGRTDDGGPAPLHGSGGKDVWFARAVHQRQGEGSRGYDSRSSRCGPCERMPHSRHPLACRNSQALRRLTPIAEAS